MVMPFGLTNAPATFQATMNEVFSPFLNKFVTVFFDDIMVYSASWEDHLYHLSQVLSCLQQHSLFAKLSKCSFGKTSLDYVGHVVSREGVRPYTDKVEAIMTWPTPQTVKQLRGFLGLTGYYRKFIKNYAHITFD